jgi:Tfp pilus assembly protein PilF
MQAYVDEQNSNKTTVVDIYSKFGEDGSSDTIKARTLYIQGLVYLAQGDKSSASKCFAESLEINPTSVWTKYFKGTCK